VVGSGTAGLAGALVMARCGYRVAVFESHDKAGGCTHMFIRNGFEFETGLHYGGKSLVDLVELLMPGDVKWSQLGREDPEELA